MWECTDPDCNQWQRVTSWPKLEMIQSTKMPDDTYIVYSMTIDMDDYSINDMINYLKFYYQSPKDIPYMNNIELCKLTAECIFETDGLTEHDSLIENLTADEAKQYIQNHISMEN